MTASRDEMIDLAVSEGLELDEAEALSDKELADMLDGDVVEFDIEYQDQGSYDAPVQTDTAQTEVASDVGTAELREEAARRVSGINVPREPFPWEGNPPRPL